MTNYWSRRPFRNEVPRTTARLSGNAYKAAVMNRVGLLENFGNIAAKKHGTPLLRAGGSIYWHSP